MPMCHVYIIECKSTKPYPAKVGVATCPKKRMAELQTGSPYPLHLIASIPFKTRGEAYDFEAFVHNGHRWCCLGGEWFNSNNLKINKSIKMWNSFCEIGGEAKKKALRIENSHGSKIETENARLKQKNYALMIENKKLKQDIEDCLDSVNFGFNDNNAWILIK